MLEKIEEKYLKFVCKHFLGGFVRREEIEIEGIRREVFIFKESNMAGFGAFWGRILLNHRLFEQEEIALKQVFLHEIGHTERPFLDLLAGVSQFILSPVGLLIGFSTLVGLTIFSGEASNSAVMLILLAYILSPIISRIGEIQANFFAINFMGADNFEEAIRIRRNNRPKLNPLEKFSMMLRYPKTENILKLYRIVHK